MGTLTRRLTDEEFKRYIRVVLNPLETELAVAAVCCVAIGTGARIGEVLDMSEKDLFDRAGNPLERVTRTLEKKRSKKPKRLTVEFPWEALGGPVIRWREKWIRHFVNDADDRLFSVRWNRTPMCYMTCWRKQRMFLERAGIDPNGVAFHGIRKSFLSTMFYRRYRENHGDFLGAARYAQELAGHESLETTLKYLSDCLGLSHRNTLTGAINDLIES